MKVEKEKGKTANYGYFILLIYTIMADIQLNSILEFWKN